MTFFTYILQSEKTKRHYIGSCEDLGRRLSEHNSGKTKSTKHGQPWKVVYSEDFDNRNDAYRREKQIKSYKGGKAFRNLISIRRDG
ncbi:endonuclease [Candidatus Berkelbacteria bacterium CG10_big_fil_rev_8_21_14_0_10_43_13]|uniref:Endonuclease n=1 Tax=Candidatus Berkelbacteria bacterium CG10_big_fil_rev_8_21_14_0_10_43_13 TaxID=1974514 RepID=A0A2H0W7U6_9BACT|nr:MAG: endonuclease [Candidatus Berkelbacteria bacterium CG10_big_fil_rev_8_21_14_0_10_43_13]